MDSYNGHERKDNSYEPAVREVKLDDEEIDRLYHEMIGQAGEAWEEEEEKHYHPAG